MERIRIKATVIEKKESVVRPGTFYVTAASVEFGNVKFVTTKKTLKIGDEVDLVTQKLRARGDMIRWEEIKI